MSVSDNERIVANNRWWEFYFIRYFVGTVVGGVIIYYLNVSKKSPFHQLISPSITKTSDLHAGEVWFLGALGLTYCYIASAPIFSLHVARLGFVERDWLDWRSCALVCVILTLIIMTFGYYTASIPNAVAAALLCICISIEVWAFVFAIAKGDDVYKYYCALACLRTKESAPIREYVESYRHLREHGNAYLILIFEFALGVLVWYLPNAYWAIALGVVWILPAALFWFVGHRLECKMVAMARMVQDAQEFDILNSRKGC